MYVYTHIKRDDLCTGEVGTTEGTEYYKVFWHFNMYVEKDNHMSWEFVN